MRPLPDPLPFTVASPVTVQIRLRKAGDIFVERDCQLEKNLFASPDRKTTDYRCRCDRVYMNRRRVRSESGLLFPAASVTASALTLTVTLPS